MITSRYNDLHEYTQETALDIKIGQAIEEFEEIKMNLAIEFGENLKTKGFIINDYFKEMRIHIFSHDGYNPIFEFSFIGQLDVGIFSKYYELEIKNYSGDDELLMDGKIINIKLGVGSNSSADPKTVYIDYGIYKPSPKLLSIIDDTRIKLCEAFTDNLKEAYMKHVHTDILKKQLIEENNWWSLDGQMEFKIRPTPYEYKIKFSNDVVKLLEEKDLSANSIGIIAGNMMKKIVYKNRADKFDPNIPEELVELQWIDGLINGLEDEVQEILGMPQDEKSMWWLEMPGCRCDFVSNLNSDEYLHNEDCLIHNKKEDNEKIINNG